MCLGLLRVFFSQCTHKKLLLNFLWSFLRCSRDFLSLSLFISQPELVYVITEKT